MPRKKMTEEQIERVIYDLTKRDVIDYVLRTVTKAENFWRYLHRMLIADGVQVSATSNIDVDYEEPDESNGGEGRFVISWNLNVYIPESLIAFIAELRRKKLWKPRKPHPIIRQRYRIANEISEEDIREIESAIGSGLAKDLAELKKMRESKLEGGEKGNSDGEGIKNSGSR